MGKQALTILLALALSAGNLFAQDTWQIGNTTLTEYDLAIGINLPWEILWGADDHIWCSTRVGDVLRIDPETGSFETILEKSVMNGGAGEGGMLGMCMDPNFPTDPYVYIVYCTGSAWSGEEVVSRFTWNGTELTDETILIDNIPAGGIHNGSRIMVMEDNTLLMTTGDVGDGNEYSQDPASIPGKTLRLNLDGSIPADNPDPTSYVWSWGHRNSQGLCQGPNGLVYSSEHGQSNSDEFNIIYPGGNYGWPNVEGACNTPSEITFCEENNVIEPLDEWSPCVAVNGIEYYNHPAIPEWENSVLMAVLGGLSAAYERLSILHMSEDGLAIESEDQYFSDFNQRVRDVCVNPHTGAVYLAFNGTSYPGSGPNVIKEFVNEDFVSVLEIDSRPPAIQVYPNPVTTSTTLQFERGYTGGQFTIISFSGQEVFRGEISSERVEFDATDISSGKYFVRAEAGRLTATQTFVVK